MGHLRSRSLLLSERARTTVLELLAYAARSDGPLTPREAAALDGAALGIGAPVRVPRGAALPLPSDDARLLPPCLHELSTLERRVAFGAAAWMVRIDGVESLVPRAFLDFIAEEAGLGPGEIRVLDAAVERARRECSEHVPLAVEFELLVIELLYLSALTASKLGPVPSNLGPYGEELAPEGVTAGGDDGARLGRAP
jgi:hypothetical protein